MTDRPIIFSGPMVRALLAGRKTQTRRIIRGMPAPPEHDSVVHPNPKHEHPYFDAYCGKKRTPENPRGMSDYWCWWTRDDREGRGCRIRYVPGDRLWVRERGWIAPSGLVFQPFVGNEGDTPHSPAGEPYRARPSIHMPRWASRITLIVEDVRVERLQAISDDDVWAEGICSAVEEHDRDNGKPAWGGIPRHYRRLIVEQTFGSAPRAFHWLWSGLHGKPGQRWEDDPFVVALTFRVMPGNIDRIAA